ncbi:MAG: hypothetical protein ACREXS_07815 [Gammaproteobacteria bacterium]
MTAAAVAAAREDANDGVKSRSEAKDGAERNLVENHDPAVASIVRDRDTLEPETNQSAAVGNHNVALLCAHCAFQ